MEEALVNDGESGREGEVAPALIAVHPLEKSVAVAIGSELRVFDLLGDHPVTLSDGSEGPQHSDAIRAICFNAKGQLFASAGDDKLVKVWATDSWRCIQTVCSEKRVTAVAISDDGLFVCFADKFGVVWTVALDGESGNQGSTNKKASPLLGHYCSIITSLEFSPDGRFIASADRDFKIRITLFPSKPLNGAHEIQSFCLGHIDYVSCLAFVHPPVCDQGFLLSGGGDSTVRLWDFVSGSLLDTCDISEKVDILESSARGEDVYPAVSDICVSKGGSLIAVAIQSFHGVVLLNCDFSAKTLAVTRVLSLGKVFIPTSLAMGYSADRLWMVMGASTLLLPDANLPLAHVKVASGFQDINSDSTSQDLVLLDEHKVPGGTKLLEKLQGSADAEKHAESLAVAAEALKSAMRSLLIKKQYSMEKREHRKRGRNDRKLKM